MKKPTLGKFDIKHVMRISTAVIFFACLVGVGVVSLFIVNTITRITRPAEATNVPVRIEGVDDALLQKLLDAQATKGSDDKRLPDAIKNPFAAPPPPPAPVEPTTEVVAPPTP